MNRVFAVFVALSLIEVLLLIAAVGANTVFGKEVAIPIYLTGMFLLIVSISGMVTLGVGALVYLTYRAIREVFSGEGKYL